MLANVTGYIDVNETHVDCNSRDTLVGVNPKEHSWIVFVIHTSDCAAVHHVCEN